MKRPIKRYDCVEQILADIDKYRAKMERHLKEADRLESLGREAINDSEPGEARDEWGKSRLLEAYRQRRYATGILMNKLPFLGGKLSEFLTPPLPNCGINDRTISSK